MSKLFMTIRDVFPRGYEPSDNGSCVCCSLLFWPMLSLVISGTQYVHGYYPYQKVSLCPSHSDLEGTVGSVEQIGVR